MERNISSDLIRGHIDTIILHTLFDGDKYAQLISDTIAQKSNNSYNINQATLYSSLKRLENQKYVKSYWFDSTDGRRKFFKITESGKVFAENNQYDWSYSRNVIDQLMDCEQKAITHIIQTEKVQQIEQKPLENVQNLPKVEEKPVIIEQKVEQKPVEVNYKGLIKDLLKDAYTPIIKETTPLEPTKTEQIPLQEPSQLKFEEKINDKPVKTHTIDTGKIDYSDLFIKATQEGYKVRVSSKNTFNFGGVFLINKINFFTSLFVTLFMLAQFFLLKSKIALLNTQTFKNVFSLVFIYPFVALLCYAKSPKKTKTNITNDSILICFIIIFNLILITFAVNLLLELDLSNLNISLYSLYLPLVLYVNALINFVARYYISKHRYFKINKN